MPNPTTSEIKTSSNTNDELSSVEMLVDSQKNIYQTESDDLALLNAYLAKVESSAQTTKTNANCAAPKIKIYDSALTEDKACFGLQNEEQSVSRAQSSKNILAMIGTAIPHKQLTVYTCGIQNVFGQNTTEPLLANTAEKFCAAPTIDDKTAATVFGLIGGAASLGALFYFWKKCRNSRNNDQGYQQLPAATPAPQLL